MSERLTDEKLTNLERWAGGDLHGREQLEVWAAVDEIRTARGRIEALEAALAQAIDLLEDAGPQIHAADVSELRTILAAKGDGE